MKGIILAGGSGTRLYPITLATSKQLLPVYDKPMIYYPLSVLMLAKIREILIISTPIDLPRFKQLLGDGKQLGLKISYAEQKKPEGLAQAFLIGKSFIKNDSCALILGDNIFYGSGLSNHLKNSVARAEAENMSTIYVYYVNSPENYGIVDLSKNKPGLIVEKPKKPKSNYCVTGLYFFPKDIVKMAQKIKKSPRGEYEITDLNNNYIKQNRTHITILGRGYSWLDAGTHESLMDASNYVKTIEDHQGILMCCPEEIAYLNNWINRSELLELSKRIKNTNYSKHLVNVIENKIKYQDLK